uniref:Uncharacterized protein n=1 Tax=Rhizophagus irregularis (strain DAOM 181602 / DAOM 197198 / MUCL 43194) TaxID=747089 RepID=U9TSD6_RHIID
MYYKGYGNHCYSQDAVTQIEDLSYISLQVYLPIHLNIFASQTVKGVAREIFNYSNYDAIKNSIINIIQ